MAGKFVRYNGGTHSYYACTDPKDLEFRKAYKVIAIKDLGWQTNYTLEGIDGEFNSIWFDEEPTYPASDKIYMAISAKVPISGSRCSCSKLEFIDGQPKLVDWITSLVIKVELLGNNIYKVTTCNSVYLVMVRI